MDKIVGYLNSFATKVKVIAAPLAGVILIILGICWMVAKDEQKKHGLVSWMVNVVIGFALVFAAASLVTWGQSFIK
ncbi:pilin [Heyndrickxia ginsengihumi]|uniref:pilin n=1 Tax=Heyndrickxia ginsengihumi TaxID=363870 RepID=UPI00046F4A96|nr:pilin [Heyndrickxia ginsengihumi]